MSKIKSYYCKIQNVCYYLKCRFWKKYNRVIVKTLPPTWIDRCDLLTHAMFQILVDFIEKEKPFDYLDTEASYNTKEWKEIKDIYNWWIIEGAHFDSMYDYDSIEHTSLDDMWEKLPNGSYRLLEYKTRKEKDWWKKVHKREDDHMKIVEKNMKRLVELRYMLWT